MHILGRDFTRRELERRTGNLDQIGGTTHGTLRSGRSKDVHIIEFNTGTGFSFTTVPDRGLDIAIYAGEQISMLRKKIAEVKGEEKNDR